MDYVTIEVRGDQNLSKLMNILSCINNGTITLSKSDNGRTALVEHGGYEYTFNIENDTLVIAFSNENVDFQLRLKLRDFDYGRLCIKIDSLFNRFWRIPYIYERDDEDEEE